MSSAPRSLRADAMPARTGFSEKYLLQPPQEYLCASPVRAVPRRPEGLRFFGLRPGHRGSGPASSVAVRPYAGDAATAGSPIICPCPYSLTGASPNPAHVRNAVFGGADAAHFSPLLSDFKSRLPRRPFQRRLGAQRRLEYSATAFLVASLAAFACKAPGPALSFSLFYRPHPRRIRGRGNAGTTVAITLYSPLLQEAHFRGRMVRAVQRNAHAFAQLGQVIPLPGPFGIRTTRVAVTDPKVIYHTGWAGATRVRNGQPLPSRSRRRGSRAGKSGHKGPVRRRQAGPNDGPCGGRENDIL